MILKYLIALLLVTRIPSTLTDEEVSSSETKNCPVKYYYCCEFGNDEEEKVICLKNCPSYDCESEPSTTEEPASELTTEGAYDEVDFNKPTDESTTVPGISPVNVIVTPILKCPAGKERDHMGGCREQW